MIIGNLASAVASSDHHRHGSVVFYVVIGVIMVLAAAQVVNPRLGWQARRWQYKNADALEPSHAALLASRLTGVAALVIGIVIIVVVASRG